MTLAVLNIVVALFLGYGAVAELWIRGVRGGETQPFIIGVIGALASLALAVSGVARLRRWANARQLTIFTAVALIAFHVYAALPPHRNVGIAVALIATVYGLALLAASFAGRNGGRAGGARRRLIARPVREFNG
jgi:peptidoglycan/LPS O-acetylase OafA/YrhL